MSVFLVTGCAIALWRAAEVARGITKQNLKDEIIRVKYLEKGDGPSANQLESVLNRVDQLKEGAFRPFSEQPLIRAVLLPFGGLCWAAITELAEPIITNVMLSHP